MKHFMSFSGLVDSLKKGLVQMEDLNGASFAFNCMREHVFPGPGLVPIEVAMQDPKLDLETFGNESQVSSSHVTLDVVRFWDTLRDKISYAHQHYRTAFRADLYQYALESLRRGDQVWFDERWLTLDEVEYHLGMLEVHREGGGTTSIHGLPHDLVRSL